MRELWACSIVQVHCRWNRYILSNLKKLLCVLRTETVLPIQNRFNYQFILFDWSSVGHWRCSELKTRCLNTAKMTHSFFGHINTWHNIVAITTVLLLFNRWKLANVFIIEVNTTTVFLTVSKRENQPASERQIQSATNDIRAEQNNINVNRMRREFVKLLIRSVHFEYNMMMMTKWHLCPFRMYFFGMPKSDSKIKNRDLLFLLLLIWQKNSFECCYDYVGVYCAILRHCDRVVDVEQQQLIAPER